MPHGLPKISPSLTSRTVFFIGNGVLRVAPGAPDNRDSRALRSPSWSEYMDSLWSCIKIPLESPKFLSLEDFSRLSAPRQAEWFDREFKELYDDQIDVAALRLHLLGRVLHPNNLMLTNPLFRELADLIVECATKSEAENVYLTSLPLMLTARSSRISPGLSSSRAV